MSILARRALKAQQPPNYAALETLTKEAVDILEELADQWTLTSHNGNDENDVMEARIESVIVTARKLGL